MQGVAAAQSRHGRLSEMGATPTSAVVHVTALDNVEVLALVVNAHENLRPQRKSLSMSSGTVHTL